MKILIEEIKENPDGSADAVINFDNEGLKYLIQYAVIDILTKYVEQNPIEQPTPTKTPTKKVKLSNAITKRKATTQKGIHRRSRHDT